MFLCRFVCVCVWVNLLVLLFSCSTLALPTRTNINIKHTPRWPVTSFFSHLSPPSSSNTLHVFVFSTIKFRYHNHNNLLILFAKGFKTIHSI